MTPALADEAPVTNASVQASESIEARIARGNYREAIEHCAREYAVPLARICMAFTGSAAETEELVQETLVAAYRAFPSYRADGSVRAFVFGIARKLCSRHNETRARQKARLFLVQDHDAGADAAELLLARERASRAREALKNLRPTEREATVLRYAGELSFREVATACGVDEATARKRVSRGLCRLRKDLGEE